MYLQDLLEPSPCFMVIKDYVREHSEHVIFDVIINLSRAHLLLEHSTTTNNTPANNTTNVIISSVPRGRANHVVRFFSASCHGVWV